MKEPGLWRKVGKNIYDVLNESNDDGVDCGVGFQWMDGMIEMIMKNRNNIEEIDRLAENIVEMFGGVCIYSQKLPELAYSAEFISIILNLLNVKSAPKRNNFLLRMFLFNCDANLIPLCECGILKRFDELYSVEEEEFSRCHKTLRENPENEEKCFKISKRQNAVFELVGYFMMSINNNNILDDEQKNQIFFDVFEIFGKSRLEELLSWGKFGNKKTGSFIMYLSMPILPIVNLNRKYLFEKSVDLFQEAFDEIPIEDDKQLLTLSSKHREYRYVLRKYDLAIVGLICIHYNFCFPGSSNFFYHFNLDSYMESIFHIPPTEHNQHPSLLLNCFKILIDILLDCPNQIIEGSRRTNQNRDKNLEQIDIMHFERHDSLGLSEGKDKYYVTNNGALFPRSFLFVVINNLCYPIQKRSFQDFSQAEEFLQIPSSKSSHSPKLAMYASEIIRRLLNTPYQQCLIIQLYSTKAIDHILQVFNFVPANLKKSYFQIIYMIFSSEGCVSEIKQKMINMSLINVAGDFLQDPKEWENALKLIFLIVKDYQVDVHKIREILDEDGYIDMIIELSHESNLALQLLQILEKESSE